MCWRVKASRWANYRLLGGSAHQMVSTRVYVEQRHVWRITIDVLFLIIRWETNHCGKAAQFDAQASASETSTQPAREAPLAGLATKGGVQ